MINRTTGGKYCKRQKQLWQNNNTCFSYVGSLSEIFTTTGNLTDRTGLLQHGNLVLNPEMCMCTLAGVPSIPLLPDASYYWSVLVHRSKMYSLPSYYLSTNVKFSPSEEKCRVLPTSQLGYEEDKNSYQWQAHACLLTKHNYVTMNENPTLLLGNAKLKIYTSL